MRFFRIELPSSDEQVQNLVKNHSYCESYLGEAEAAFKKSGVQAVNSIVMLFGGELEAPQSIESDAYSLTYLGRFRCDPNPVATTDSYIPYSLFLILDDGELFFDEYMRKVISVDPRGLCIGDCPTILKCRYLISPKKYPKLPTSKSRSVATSSINGYWQTSQGMD